MRAEIENIRQGILKQFAFGIKDTREMRTLLRLILIKLDLLISLLESDQRILRIK